MSETNQRLWPHTGAIFCGGQSSRMGQPKSNITLPEGLTMLEKVYQALSQVCRQVVLVGKNEEISESLTFLKRVEDKHKGLGPIGGLEALLSSGLDSEYLITPCDLPQIVPEVFQILIGSKDEPPVLISDGHEIEPLIGRYQDSFLDTVQNNIRQKKYAMKGLFDGHQIHVVSLSEELLPAITNANTPEDLKL